MKRVAIYIRVSTNEQFQEGYSIQAQRERLISYCKAKDWLVQDVYIDGGYSGSNIDRPALNRLLNCLNDIDIVLVYKLDRLSRSQKDTLYLIEDEFIANDVDFVSVTENFDTTTPFGRAMIGILSVFAQLERENIRERSKIGRIERAKKGLWAGTPNPPIGYDLIDSTLVVNEYEAVQVKEVFELYLKGYGSNRIQDIFIDKGYTTKYGDWKNISTHTIYRIIDNRVYIGEISFAGKWYKGIHTPIIDKDTFNKAMQYRKKRKGHRRGLKYFLSGLLYCGDCGEKYVSDKKGSRSFYICKNRKMAYKQDFKCENVIFTINELEKMAIKKMKAMLKDKSKIAERKAEIANSNDKKSNNDAIKKRIKEVDKQIDKLMDLYQLDTIPINELSSRISKLHEEKQLLDKNLVEEHIGNEVNIEEIIDKLTDFDDVWNSLTVDARKSIANLLLGNKIYVSSKGI